MASIPFLVPALLTSIPAALCLTWIYRRRRNRPHRPELIHLHSLRSSLMRKKAKKRMRLGDDAMEESRSLLASVDRTERHRRSQREEEGEEETNGDVDHLHSLRALDSDPSSPSSDDDFDDFDEASEDDDDEGEHAVEIELDAVMADLNHQLRAEKLLQQQQTADTDNADSQPLLPPSSTRLRPRSSSSHRRKGKRSPLPDRNSPFPPSSASSPPPLLTGLRSKHRSIYGILYINLLEASTPTTASTFCVISHGTQVYRTHSSTKSNQPLFNQKVRLVIREREVAWPVGISLWVKRGKRRGGGVYCVGRASLDVREMMGDGGAGGEGDGGERKRKRKADEPPDAAYTVKNYWQTLIINPTLPPAQPSLTSSISAASDADSFDPSPAYLPSSYPLLPRATSLTASISATSLFYSSTTIESRLHLETLFLPVPSSTIGPGMWNDICSLYDVHDEGRVDANHVTQLMACIGGMREEDRQLMSKATATGGSMSVDELTSLLVRCEAEREREVRERKRSMKRNGEDSVAATEVNTPASTSGPSSSASSSSLSSFLIDVPLTPSAAVLPETTALTPVYLSKCPVCLLDLTPSSSLDPRDCLIHVRFCLETLHSLSPESSTASSEFAMGGFISEEYAVKNWASSMMTGEHYGSDKLLTYLSSRAHFILVQDRSTGQLRPEKVPFLVKLLMRFVYQSALGRHAYSSLSFGLMARMTEMMGRKYDHESSKGHIGAFVAYYAIDMAEFEKPIDAYATFNDFFYRRLRPGRRPIAGSGDDSVIVSPADCRITVFQSVSEATRIWIKGKTFSLSSLLVDPQLVRDWPDCSLAIARLAPDDYHRFHLPLACTVGESRTYSGGYASVNPLAIRSQRDVLTQNKRVLTQLHHTVVGDVLYIAVGAAMVGSVIITAKEGERKDKGDEHGYFAFGGSTVLLLFRQGSVRFDDDLLYNTSKSMETLIRMGESIGRVAGGCGRGVVGDVGVTRSTINPLSARKLEENDEVIGQERRAEGEVDGEGEEEEGADLFTVGDLNEEEVREVRGLLLTGDM